MRTCDGTPIAPGTSGLRKRDRTVYAARLAQLEEGEQWQCTDCHLIFLTEGSLKVHRAVKHPSAYNDELLETKRHRVTESELRRIAREELRITQGTIMDDARGLVDELFLSGVANRSIDMLRKIRARREYQEIRLNEFQALQQRLQAGNTNDNGDIPAEGIPTHIGEDGNDLNQEGVLRLKAQAEVLRYILHPTAEEADSIHPDILAYANAALQGRDTWLETRDKLLPPHKPRRNRPVRVGRGPLRNHRRKNRFTARYERFKLTQELLRDDRKATLNKIFEGQELTRSEEFPDIVDVENTFVERLENNDSQDTSPTIFGEPCEPCESTSFGAFPADFVLEVHNKIDGKSAPGRDGVIKKQLTKLGKVNLAIIMNLWFWRGIPPDCKKNRTILLHKKGDRKVVDNWRPITIGDLLVRLYAKLWDTRLRKVIQIEERQQAFRPVDGCLNNVKMIQYMIKQSRKNKKELNIVFLDLSKAFDKVLHTSIHKALLRKGVATDVIDTILTDLYGGASTEVTIRSNKSTRPINIRNGVKQGCTLSPFLFNLVIDELMTRLRESKLGVSVGEELVAGMAFADDLSLAATSAEDMVELLKICEEFFDSKALEVNATKCSSLRLVPATNSKRMKVITTVHRWWKNTGIPCVTFEDMDKYLGVKITPLGEVLINVQEWKRRLENLRKAALKPFQRADAIRDLLVPRLIHLLRLSDAQKSVIKRVFGPIKTAYKRCLHLPDWTSDSWLHHPKGGRLPNLLLTIARSRVRSTVKMAKSSDRAIVTMGLGLEVKAQKLKRLVGFDGIEDSKWEETEELNRRLKLKGELNGEARLTMLKSSHGRGWWLWSGNMKGSYMVNTLRMLSGTLPTKINTTRGRPDLSKLCRRCHATAETDIHVLQICPANQSLIKRRHDIIVRRIGADLRDKGWTVAIERVFMIASGRRHPDLWMYKDNIAILADVQIPYEKDEATLKDRLNKKQLKYDELLNECGFPDTATERKVLGLIIGAAGTMIPETETPFRELQLKSKLNTYCRLAAEGSSKIWFQHTGNWTPEVLAEHAGT